MGCLMSTVPSWQLYDNIIPLKTEKHLRIGEVYTGIIMALDNVWLLSSPLFGAYPTGSIPDSAAPPLSLSAPPLLCCFSILLRCRLTQNLVLFIVLLGLSVVNGLSFPPPLLSCPFDTKAPPQQGKFHHQSEGAIGRL